MGAKPGWLPEPRGSARGRRWGRPEGRREAGVVGWVLQQTSGTRDPWPRPRRPSCQSSSYLGRFLGPSRRGQRRQWHPLQYPCLENAMDGGAWWAAVRGVTKSPTRLSDFTLLLTFTHWRRQWQPTPGFLPADSQGRRSLVGCPLRGRTESDTTEVTQRPRQQQEESLSVPAKRYLGPSLQGKPSLERLSPHPSPSPLARSSVTAGKSGRQPAGPGSCGRFEGVSARTEDLWRDSEKCAQVSCDLFLAVLHPPVSMPQELNRANSIYTVAVN